MWHANRRVYGAKKVFNEMNGPQITVARCTVVRLMDALGLRGVVRAMRPNQFWVADHTHVATWRG